MRIFGVSSFFKTRKKLAFFLLFLVLIAAAYYFFWYKKWDENQDIAWKEQEIWVTRQDITSSLSVTWKSKIKNEQSLNFNTPGKVTAVYVEIGQEVIKDALLAEIDKKEVLSAVQEKQIELEQASLKYENLLWERDIESQKMQNEIENKKRDLEKKQNDRLLLDGEQKLIKANQNINLQNTQLEFQKSEAELANALKALERLPDEKTLELTDLQNTLSQQKKEYDTEFSRLDDILQKQINSYDINLQTEYYTTVNSLRSIDTLLKSYNELLRIRSDIDVKNNQLEEYFSAKDSRYKSHARKYYLEVWEKHSKLEDTINGKTTLENTDIFLDILDQEISLYRSLYELSKNISLWVDQSLSSVGVVEESEFQVFQSQANGNMTESTAQIIEIQKKQDEVRLFANPQDENEKKVSELQAKKNQIQKLEYNLLKAEEEFQNISGTNSFEIQKLKLTLETKKNELKLKEIEYQKLSQTQDFDIASADAAIESAKLDLQDAQKKHDEYLSPSNESFSLAKNTVKQAQIALENEQKNIEKYELRAPFAGTVSQMNIFVGDNLIDQDKTKNISLQNPYIVEVQVQVDQVDLVKISRGQETQVFFDAYPETAFSGSVTDVSGTPNTDSGLSKYEVKILIDTQDVTEKIYSGMSARAEIILQKLSQVIAIPSLSIELDTETGESFVTKVSSDGTRKKQVVEWWFSDGVQTEIIKGLQEGDTIIEVNFSENTLPEESFWNPYNRPF